VPRPTRCQPGKILLIVYHIGASYSNYGQCQLDLQLYGGDDYTRGVPKHWIPDLCHLRRYVSFLPQLLFGLELIMPEMRSCSPVYTSSSPKRAAVP
jgi:hypothetical protein